MLTKINAALHLSIDTMIYFFFGLFVLWLMINFIYSIFYTIKELYQKIVNFRHNVKEFMYYLRYKEDIINYINSKKEV